MQFSPKTNFDKLQSRPERKTSLDKCISKISADYKNDQIRTIQDLTQEKFEAKYKRHLRLKAYEP